MPNVPTPPDFSKWALRRHESLCLNLKTKHFEMRPIHKNDSQDAFWVGHVTFYKDKTGLGDGCAYNIFGQGVVLKLWGLQMKQGEPWHSFTILAGGTWNYFSGSRHFSGIQGIKQKRDLSNAPFSAVRIYAEDRNTEQPIFELIVPRDLLLLPPAQNKIPR